MDGAGGSERAHRVRFVQEATPSRAGPGVNLRALLLTAALAGVFSFHLPTHDALAPRSCAPGPAPVSDLAAWSLWGSRQSPTWVAKRDSMLASASVWARYWPVVRAEAEPVRVLRNYVSPYDAGALITQARPAGSVYVFWRVTTEDVLGNESCPSNWVYLP